MFDKILINHNDIVYSFNSFTYGNVLSKYDIMIIINNAIEKLKEVDCDICQAIERNVCIISTLGVIEFKYQNGSLFVNFKYDPDEKEFELTYPPRQDDVKDIFIAIHQKEKVSQFRCIEMMNKLTGLNNSNIFNSAGM